MSFLSNIFGRKESAVERDLLEMYTNMLCQKFNYSTIESNRMAKEGIAICKQQAIEEGSKNLPDNFGDLLIEAAGKDDNPFNKLVETARSEGATDLDIREYWNLPDLCRRMVNWSEGVFRYAVFLHEVENNEASAEDAAAVVHKMFPTYGDPVEENNQMGDDRKIPHELRGRVDIYRQTHGAEYITERVSNFSSYNAFVRSSIKDDLI